MAARLERVLAARIQIVGLVGCNPMAENRAKSRHGVTSGALRGVGLCRWPPEDHQLADGTAEPQHDRDQQTPPAVEVVVEAGGVEQGVVQAELSGSDGGD